MEIYKCKAKIKQNEISKIISKLYDLNISFVILKKKYDLKELKFCYFFAKKSFKKNPISKSFEGEFMLWLSKKNQIEDAIKEIGADSNLFFLIYFDKGKQKLEKIKKELKIEKCKENESVKKNSVEKNKKINLNKISEIGLSRI